MLHKMHVRHRKKQRQLIRCLFRRYVIWDHQQRCNISWRITYVRLNIIAACWFVPCILVFFSSNLSVLYNSNIRSICLVCDCVCRWGCIWKWNIV